MAPVPSNAVRATELVSEILTLVTTDVFEQRLTAASGSVPVRPQSHSESEQNATHRVNNLGRKNDASGS